QIAGLIARRVVCDVVPGDSVRAGQRVGLIRFGSRVDILMPAAASLSVQVGDRVRAGESVVGVVQ
ncbi:MAG TPA: phosphatidylserine decarboxylase, partial [Candidatus Deferrimicrobiaceae bacterium]